MVSFQLVKLLSPYLFLLCIHHWQWFPLWQHWKKLPWPFHIMPPPRCLSLLDSLCWPSPFYLSSELFVPSNFFLISNHFLSGSHSASTFNVEHYPGCSSIVTLTFYLSLFIVTCCHVLLVDSLCWPRGSHQKIPCIPLPMYHQQPKWVKSTFSKLLIISHYQPKSGRRWEHSCIELQKTRLQCHIYIIK